jgi:acyl carrier protein
MTPAEIERSVKGIIVRQLCIPEDSVKPSSMLMQELNFDSLDCVEVVMELEEQFNLSIPDEDAEKWKTVKDIADYIIKKTKAQD